MSPLAKLRIRRRYSQRRLALLARLSYKTLQLVESGRDARLSTIGKIARALGYPKTAVRDCLDHVLSLPPESLYFTALAIRREGAASWAGHLGDFVDAFRRRPDVARIADPPPQLLPDSLRALMAASVETLCAEAVIEPPAWCRGVEGLPDPWFVAGIENLKVTALVESPVHFRKRNIFVLGNFLDRA